MGQPVGLGARVRDEPGALPPPSRGPLGNGLTLTVKLKTQTTKDTRRALSEQSAQYIGLFMTVPLENLQSDVLNRNVKFSVLSCHC